MARALIPNSTQVPDIILDHWMAKLSGAEFKVLLYVARRTYGFGKESDNISLNQMASGIRRRDGTWLDHGTGLSRSGVKAACNGLIGRGILIRVNNRNEESRECEESTYRLNLYAQNGVGQKRAKVGQPVTQVGQKVRRGGPVVARGVGHNLAPQETDQETDQETAAGERNPGGLSADAGLHALVDELVSHGVGRATAERLVAEKPEMCRRQLGYLPHASVRTTKGAWLANAIRDGYGPPVGFEKKRDRVAEEREAERVRLRAEAQRKRKARQRDAERMRVGEAYRALLESQGKALKAFNEQVEKERAKLSRIASRLSPERREEMLASFDRPERRLALFEAWVRSRKVNLASKAGAVKDQATHSRGGKRGGLFSGTSLLESHPFGEPPTSSHLSLP